MYSCLVVDDEPLASRLISSYVERTPFLSLAGEAQSAEDALALLDSATGIDLIFLDIRMPRLSGMQLAKVLPKGVKVVFTTAYADHAVDGFRVGALDYLLKPVSYEDFLHAATRARDAFELERRSGSMTDPAQIPRSTFLTVKSEYRLMRIPTSDIVYIEGMKDYVKIYTDSDGDKPVLSLMSMKSIEEALPSPDFVRVHRSYIVNTDRVRLIERNSILMAGRNIPVGESYRRRFFEAIESRS